MRKFIIEENVLQALGQYLLSKPMVEVRQLVQALEQLQEIKPADEKKETDGQ